jgi:hypothetical protein
MEETLILMFCIKNIFKCSDGETSEQDCHGLINLVTHPWHGTGTRLNPLKYMMIYLLPDWYIMIIIMYFET